MTAMHAMTKVVVHTGKIRSASHFGKKMSATDPLVAPRRSASSVKGQIHPNATSTTPSRTTRHTATQVHMVIRSVRPLNSVNTTQPLSTQKMIVWMSLIWNIVNFTIASRPPVRPRGPPNDQHQQRRAVLPRRLQRFVSRQLF